MGGMGLERSSEVAGSQSSRAMTLHLPAEWGVSAGRGGGEITQLASHCQSVGFGGCCLNGAVYSLVNNEAADHRARESRQPKIINTPGCELAASKKSCQILSQTPSPEALNSAQIGMTQA